MKRLFVVIAVACLLPLLWPEALAAMRWQRGALAEGQWWRVLSAHFVHLSAMHALANLLGLALVIEWLGAAVRPFEAAVILLFSALAIIVGFTLHDPELRWYAGLSGVVHGLWAGCALLAWWRSSSDPTPATRRSLPVAALALLVLKLAGTMAVLPIRSSMAWPTLMPGLPVVPQSHLYGALGGALASALAAVIAASGFIHHSSSAAKPWKFRLE